MTTSQVWKHCRPPGSGPVTYTASGSSLGWLFTCPYCYLKIDSHNYTSEKQFEGVCEIHLDACRDHTNSLAVQDAMKPLTEHRDEAGRPIHKVTARRGGES